jgi:hypothetical protein
MNFDEITQKISAWCVEHDAEVTYTDENNRRIFRFSKGTAEVVKIISYVDLEYKDSDILAKEIDRVLDKLDVRAQEQVK